MTLKLKSAASSLVSFSWDALPTSPATTSSPPGDTNSLPSPPTSWLSAKDMKMFGAEPLKYDVGLVKCKECEKPVLRSAIAEHLDNCERVRVLVKKGIKGKSAEVEGGKKRKAEDGELDDPSQPLKKKAKPAGKPGKGRLKGPIDYDKNCGVINDKGLPCSRSLTCKSHSMGAKRAVQGRSKQYDELLLEWNREHNPNFVEPTKRETKAEKKEKREREKAEKKRLALEAAAAAGIDISKKGAATAIAGGSSKKSSKKAAAAAAAAAAAVAAAEGDDAVENLDDIDSEAEVDTLVKAIRGAHERGVIGMPLANPCDASSWFVVRREKLRSCHVLLSQALALNVPTKTGFVAPTTQRS